MEFGGKESVFMRWTWRFVLPGFTIVIDGH